jgi:hypothetical protein
VDNRGRRATPGVAPLERCLVERFDRGPTDSVSACGAHEIATWFILSRNRARVGTPPPTQHVRDDDFRIVFEQFALISGDPLTTVRQRQHEYRRDGGRNANEGVRIDSDFSQV